MNASWSISEIVFVLGRVKSKGFIPIPHESFRSDEGVLVKFLNANLAFPKIICTLVIWGHLN